MGKQDGSGEVNVSTSNQTLPSKDISKVWFKAPKGNSDPIYVGWANATVADGSTNETTGFELDASESIGPINASNLDLFTVIGKDAEDSLIYFTEA
jgi:hypothetical protein